MRRKYQVPNSRFKFKCGHIYLLPNLGNSNEFVIWNSPSKSHPKGSWNCRICSLYRTKRWRRGKGSLGLLGWANYILSASKRTAKINHWVAPKITSEELVTLRKNSKYCADGCRKQLNWSNSKSIHLHHDHKTGRVHGLITLSHNHAEGKFRKIGNTQAQIQWLKFHFPEVITELAK